MKKQTRTDFFKKRGFKEQIEPKIESSREYDIFEMGREEGRQEMLKDVEKLIDKIKKRSCVVWGKWNSDDYVIEKSCSEECKCDVCNDDEIYILNEKELKQKLKKLGGEE